MSYTVGGKTYETWSAKNQRIIDRLVDREVLCCVTQEMEYMLSKVFEGDDKNPFTEDDLCNLYLPCCDECGNTYGLSEVRVRDLRNADLRRDVYGTDLSGDFVYGVACPVCGEVYRTGDEAKRCCGEDTVVYRCDNCGAVFSEDERNNLPTETPEIYEWWAVSNWFGEKLKEHGQPVIESWGKSYWGRTCTGQSISLDGCIINIAAEMGILEGMEFDWGDSP